MRTAIALLALACCSPLTMASPTGAELMQCYRVARDSIVNQRGLVAGDAEVLRALRDEIAACSNVDEDASLVSAQLQLSLWIEDHDVIDGLYSQLSALLPDDARIALEWANYAMDRSDRDPSEVFNDLMDRFPGSAQIIETWARRLDRENRFSDAAAAMARLDESSLAEPAMATLLAELLWADNRFEEAIAALDAVDQAVLDADPIAASSHRRTRDKATASRDAWEVELALRAAEDAADDLPRVQVLTARGMILAELYENQAPNTVANFVSLARDGFYDGTRFHRVLGKFMSQGGDPNSRKGADGAAGSGGPGYTIADEHTGSDFRTHFAGSLAMAKTAAPNSAGCQFYFTHLPTPHLDGRHTVFGRILDGLDVARSLQVDDEILAVNVLRTRDHAYEPQRLGDDGQPIDGVLPADRTPTIDSGGPAAGAGSG